MQITQIIPAAIIAITNTHTVALPNPISKPSNQRQSTIYTLPSPYPNDQEWPKPLDIFERLMETWAFCVGVNSEFHF